MTGVQLVASRGGAEVEPFSASSGVGRRSSALYSNSYTLTPSKPERSFSLLRIFTWPVLCMHDSVSIHPAIFFTPYSLLTPPRIFQSSLPVTFSPSSFCDSSQYPPCHLSYHPLPTSTPCHIVTFSPQDLFHHATLCHTLSHLSTFTILCNKLLNNNVTM